jgi:FKBP-type peptidyl-prolyl cis-trans isomerase FkpA
MKNLGLVLVAGMIILFSGCKKAEQLESLEDYLTRTGLKSSVTEDPRGFYYKILSAGAGATPNLTSNVTAFYKGYLTNGKVFDQTGTSANYESGSPVPFKLSGVIEGWQVGLPLIKPGGKIILYLPAKLGYGPYGQGSIPGNAALIFEITLVSVG